MGDMMRKYNNNKGATVAIALIYFVIILILGSIALTVAATNTGLFSSENNNYSDYAAVNSALRMIKEKFDGLSYSVVESVTTHSNGCLISDNIYRNDADAAFLKSARYIKSDDTIIYKREVMFDNTVTETSQTDLMRLFEKITVNVFDTTPVPMNLVLELAGFKKLSISVVVTDITLTQATVRFSAGTDGMESTINMDFIINVRNDSQNSNYQHLYNNGTQTDVVCNYSLLERTVKYTWSDPIIRKGA